MKTINKFLLSLGVMASMGLGACTGDLDLTPTDPEKVTQENFKDNPEAAMDALMGDVYLQFATYGADGNASVSGTDGGMTTFQRALFILQEVPTDEANWLPAGDADYGLIQYGIAVPNNVIMYGIYSRLMINVAVCNDFIQSVNDDIFGSLSAEAKVKAQEYIRQCRILRAACYYYLIDLWGNVPYADENVKLGDIPQQMPRAELFDIVTKELETIVREYGSDASQSWGYVGKEVAEALLVKFYLNAEVYAGQSRWADCIRHAQNIIARHQTAGFVAEDGTPTGLCINYNQAFCANNRQYANGGASPVSENLWVIPQDTQRLDSYANSMFLIAGWIGGDQNGMYNFSEAWKCMSTRPEFAALFAWDSAMASSEDQRVRWWCTSAQGFSFDKLVYDQGSWGNNGYLAIKYTNWIIDDNGNVDPNVTQPNATGFINNDYAVIRLAEIYLSAAEASMHTGDTGTALKYVNYIRERAGLQTWSDADLSLNSLYDERARELYTENCRRTDLIRAGRWISGYNWTWKNQVQGGQDFPSHYNLYPLPTTVVELAGYKQNPGY